MTEKMPIKEAKKKFIKRSFYCGVVAILVCWFMKLFGFDYFGLDLDNKFFNDLDVFLGEYYLKDLFIIFMLNLQLYFMTCIVHKKQGKEILIYLLKCLPLTIATRFISVRVGGSLSSIIEIIFLIIILSRFKIKYIFKSVMIVLANTIYQAISLTMRSLEIKSHEYTYLVFLIFSIDYIILLYLHKEVAIMGNDGTWIFLGFTAWLYRVVGFIVGLFTFHPIKKSREWYEKGKAKEDARKAKKATK
jgi:hypothetical protein